jgi:hypothetical protein
MEEHDEYITHFKSYEYQLREKNFIGAFFFIKTRMKDERILFKILTLLANLNIE